MKKALLVIDMLNDFMQEGGALYCGAAARRIIPVVVEKIKEYIAQSLPLIFAMDAHDPDDLEFLRYPPHCVYETPGARLIPEIAQVIEEYPFVIKVPKSRFSAFFRTNLNNILRDLSPELVEVAGVCTNICVLYTVEELVNRDYKVVVLKDGVASFDENAHRWALEQMQSVLGAEIK